MSCAGSRPTTAGPTPRRSTCCPICGTATAGRGSSIPSRKSLPRSDPGRRTRRIRRWGNAGGTCGPPTASRSSYCLPRTTRITSELTTRRISRRTLRTALTIVSSAAKGRRSTLSRAASSPATRTPSCRSGVRFRSRSASRQWRWPRRSPTSTPSSPAGSPKRTCFTTRFTPAASAPTSSWSAGKPSPGCFGRSSTTTTTSGAGSRAIRPRRRRPTSAGRAAITVGRNCTTPT